MNIIFRTPSRSSDRSGTRVGALVALVCWTAVTLSACHAPVVREEQPQAATPVPKPQVEVPAEPVYSSFDRETLYGLLVAELAGRRGQVALANSKYLELVRHTGDIGIAERATRIALFSQDDKASVDVAGEWARLDETNIDAQAVHAALLLRVGRTEDSIAQFNRLLFLETAEPRRAYARITDVLGREKNRAVAFSVMQQLAETRQGDLNAQFALAALATRTGNIDQAVTQLRSIQESSPDDERSAELLARVLQSQGKTEGARSVLANYLDRQPHAHSARMSYGRLLVGAEDFEGAKEQFMQVSEALPDNADARYAYAIVLMQLEQSDLAKAQFEKLAFAGKRENSSWYYLGQLAEVGGDIERALTNYRRVERGEFRLNAQIRVAVMLSQSGDIPGARAHLQGMRRQYHAERVRLYRAEADILVRAEQLEDAVSVYDGALAELPSNSDLLYARAMVAARQGNVVELERDLRVILNREPENADALNALGYTLTDKTDRHEEALGLIERAFALKPNDHYIVDSMGWVLHRLGRNDEALVHLRRAFELNGDAEVAAHLGEVLWAAGRRDEAREIWRDALEREPDADQLRAVIERLDAD